MKIMELENEMKILEDKFEQTKLMAAKNEAIGKQKQEFLELSLKEEKIKNEEMRQAHD